MTTKELQVMEGIAQYGPCTLDELTSVGAFTRSSVYRSLTKLEDSGWVRRSLDGRRYYLSNKIEKVLDQATFPAGPAEKILDAIKECLMNAKYKLALVHHVRAGAFEIVDATGGQPDALSMLLDVQELLEPIVNTMIKFGRESGSKNDAALSVVRIQDFLPDRSKDDEIFLVDDYSQTAIITLHSKAEGLFLLLCASKNIMRFDRGALSDYCKILCSSLAALDDGGVSEMHATQSERRKGRSIISLGTR